jgi:hypothetical protein
LSETPTLAEADLRHRLLNWRMLIEGIVLGAVYGVVLRVAMNAPTRLWWLRDAAGVMTVAFLVLGPIVMGFLVVRRAERGGKIPIALWFGAPVLSVTLTMAILMLFAWEGAICVVMALPIAWVFGAIGGVLGGLSVRFRKMSGRATACVALLPFVLAPLEARLTAPTQTRTVASQILIHAPATTVWQNIERVPAIAPNELQRTWAQRIGFPRPIEATLSYEGVGGVRHASFERGVMFVETITNWEPEKRLAFGIKADSANIPPTTLDEHVTIGGRYFDVLDGEYRLEPLPNGDTLLHLTSHQRLSTDFNGYAGLWTDAVMQSLQTSILAVIQHRCEHS